MEQIEARRRNVHSIGRELRKTPVWHGPAFVTKVKAVDRRKEAFRKEWNEALTYLRNIGEQLRENRPAWITHEVPIAWQIDQFLHAFYYNKVGDSRAKPFEEFFSKNHKDPQAAVTAALEWWRNTVSAPSGEDETFYTNAPKIRDCLSREKLLSLTEGDFADVCRKTHATRDHVIKMNLATLGRPEVKSMTQDDRLPLYASWLMKERNAKGQDVRQLLQFVLYEGKEDLLWDRLFTAARDDDYRMPHYGLNTIAELVGWARPEISPPRNGRTSKALRALGFDVKIY